MTKETITGHAGKPLPNLKAFGLKPPKEIAQLLGEQASLWEKGKRAGREAQALRTEKVPALKRRLVEERIKATRSGEDPDPEQLPAGKELAKTEEEIERLEGSARMMRLAGERSYAELLSAIGEHAPQMLDDLDASAGKVASRVEKEAERLRASFRELDRLGAIAGWLLEPEKSFGVGYSPSEAALDAILHAARSKAQVKPEPEEALRQLVEEPTA